LVRGLRALDIGFEVDEVDVRVALLLAVIFDLDTSPRSSTEPFATWAGSSSIVCARRCRSTTSSISFVRSVSGPVLPRTQRNCSIGWKPVHFAFGTSPARASIAGSRSPKLSATGSIRS
jgi:hypothetical protein